jgi:hypothetical protein
MPSRFQSYVLKVPASEDGVDTQQLLALRVTCTNSLSEDQQTSVVGYHCFRGLMTPGTKLYFNAVRPQGKWDS